MGSANRYAKKRARKRKGFCSSNQQSVDNSKQQKMDTPDQTQLSSPTTSTGASISKLNFSTISEPERDDSGTDIVTNCNFIIESDLFMSLILMIGKCPDCAGSVNIEHKLNDKMGLPQFSI